jgi:hypothetical protein
VIVCRDTGGSGEGGDGLWGYQKGKQGKILEKSDISDGGDRFHFPLYGKSTLKNQILNTLNSGNRWEKSFEPDEKNEIINDYSGVFIYIP